MKLEIITPYFREYSFLKGYSFSGEVPRCLVVDSGNLSNRELESLGKFNRVIVQPNTGLSAARNIGIRTSNAEFVILVDIDDFIDEEVALAAIQEHPNADIIFCSYIFVRHPSYRVVENLNSNRFLPLETITDEWGAGSAIPIHSAIFRRTVLQEFPFDPTLATREDFDLWIRLQRNAKRFETAQYPALLAYYVIRSGSMVDADR